MTFVAADFASVGAGERVERVAGPGRNECEKRRGEEKSKKENEKKKKQKKKKEENKRENKKRKASDVAGKNGALRINYFIILLPTNEPSLTAVWRAQSFARGGGEFWIVWGEQFKMGVFLAHLFWFRV
jgi:hypothetical protein